MATRPVGSVATFVAAICASTGVLMWSAASAGAVARWSPPRNVFTTEVSRIDVDDAAALALQVRSDAAGNSIAAWVQNAPTCQAMWAYRPFAGHWTTPKPLAAAGGCLHIGLALAMNATGRAAAAFVDPDGVVVATRPPGGSFGTPKIVSSSANADFPAVAINDAGTIAVAWVEQSFDFNAPSPLKARVRPAGGSYSAIETLTSTGAAWAPSLAVGPNGQVTAGWARTAPNAQQPTSTDYTVQSAFRAAGGQFSDSPVQTLASWTAAGGSPVDAAPTVALDATGRASAVWVLESNGHRMVQAAAKTAAAAQFGAIQTVNAADSGTARYPRVAVEPGTNRAVAVWLQCATSCVVRSAVRPDGGNYAGLTTLSGALPAVGNVPATVGFTSAGAAIAAWSGRVNGTGPQRVATARRPSGGPFGPAVFISGPAGAADELGPALAFDGHGNATAVWAHQTGVPSATVRYADFLASWYQPDGLIKKSTAAGYAGARIYNTTAAGQIVGTNVARGHSVTFDIKIVNRSSSKDTVAVRGSGNKPGFTVAYRAGLTGATSITNAVEAGDYRVALGPGGSKTIRLVVSAKARALVGTANFWTVAMTSSHDPARNDAVKGSATVTS